MNTTLGGDHRVQFVNDHVFDFADDRLKPRRGDGDGQTFWCRDQNVRRVSKHFLSVGLRRVSCSQTDTDFLSTIGKIVFRNLVERANQVTLDVIRQGFDGRDVNAWTFFSNFLSKARRTN